MSGLSTVSSHPPVIVVGSGLAGLSAASQVISQNIPVQLLDRAPKPGGNSIKASSGINGVPTRFQTVPDTVEAFYNDTVKSAGSAYRDSEGAERERRERLMKTLSKNAADAVYWLTDDQNINLDTVAMLGGHSAPRTHRGGPGEKPPGWSIVSTLLDNLKKSPLFNMRSGTRVTKVTKESEEVTGVEYEEVGEQKQEGSGRVEGPVIFATGGFAGDAHGMLAKYRPDLAGYPTTNDAREGTQPLLEAVGAGVVDMSAVQVHPTGFVDPKDPNAPTKILAAEMLRGEGGILLAGEGERFVDELTTRDKVTDAILAGAKKLDAGNDAGRKQWDVWLVLDAATAEATKSHLGFYKFKGLMKEMTVEDLVTEHGLPNASNAIKAYSKMVASKTRDAFNRTHYGSWALKPEEVDGSTRIVAGRVTPVVHFTMGGVNINENGAVLDTEGQQIRGLWAAGEITGGLHGDNRLGGSSLLECVVFGRRAGDDAGRWWREHYANGEEGLKIQEGGAAGREF